jgi:hypothetical protein
MNELIEKLMSHAGITAEQAQKSLEAIKDFVKEKFPMLGGAVDNIFKDGETMAAAPDPLEAAPAAAAGSGGWMDKISDIIPGDMGEKIEAMAKKAADESAEAFDKAKDVATDAFARAKEGADDLVAKAKETYEAATKK